MNGLQIQQQRALEQQEWFACESGTGWYDHCDCWYPWPCSVPPQEPNFVVADWLNARAYATPFELGAEFSRLLMDLELVF